MICCRKCLASKVSEKMSAIKTVLILNKMMQYWKKAELF